MSHLEIRKNFLNFFRERGHAIVSSSSLLPDDPSVLFTTAGMQQFKPYYTGQADPMKDFNSLNAASIQKSMRTSDIDEVGDESHLTFFEMLGNFSFGGYWKKESIQYAYDFITKEMGLRIDYVSVFGGKKDIPADKESEKIWKTIDKNIRVKKLGRKDNFWGPTGDEGPCGPTTEIYINDVEIWNIVFNQYHQNKKGELENLKTAGIDTGMGLDRLATVVQKKNMFETDLLGPILKLMPSELDDRTKRIITDHSRSVAFLISDGVRPSNKERGYILRRLMRRVIAYNFIAESDPILMHDVFAKIFEIYGQHYSNINTKTLIFEFDHEKEKFEKILKQGLKELEKLEKIDAQIAFRLYESHGLPFEIIKYLGGDKAKNLIREHFDKEFKKHQKISRAGTEKKFGGHGLLLDTGELKAGDKEELKKATRLHTATHLLQAALRKILGNEIQQNGSDITAERLRFDFTFLRKITSEELEKVQNLVIEVIKKDLAVIREEMPYEKAIKNGAIAFFKEKYPKIVSVYSVIDKKTGETFSRELCGGPHVEHTGEIGKFIIKKEEAIGAGIRRIRAIVD